MTLTPHALEAAVRSPVSRETVDRLNALADTARLWTPKINLIARSTIATLETRHILDSAQLWPLSGSERADQWVDVGSGGGFPGLVIAVLAHDLAPRLEVTLIESDARKCAFLSSVISTLGLSTRVERTRIENATARGADILSARALAPLSRLLPLCERLIGPRTIALFPKGVQADSELSAVVDWSFTLRRVQSITDPSGVVLVLSEIKRS